MSTAAVSTTYSISQVSKSVGLESHTLRFYEKEGILTPSRTEGGIRYFSESDLERLGMICCLKRTGMPLKDIKRYFDLVERGEETLEERIAMFEERREHVLEEIEALKQNLEKVNWKINLYNNLLEEREKK